MTNVDNLDDLALLLNTPVPAESLLHRLEQVAEDIGLDVKANKIEYMF